MFSVIAVSFGTSDPIRSMLRRGFLPENSVQRVTVRIENIDIPALSAPKPDPWVAPNTNHVQSNTAFSSVSGYVASACRTNDDVNCWCCIAYYWLATPVTFTTSSLHVSASRLLSFSLFARMSYIEQSLNVGVQRPRINRETQSRSRSPFDIASAGTSRAHTPRTSDDSNSMDDRRPPLHRPTDGRSEQPLLDEERGRTYDERPPMFSRRSTMRSRSPDTQAKLATKKKYTYAAFFLGLSLISFVVQTETAVYIQHELGWNKAYCML